MPNGRTYVQQVVEATREVDKVHAINRASAAKRKPKPKKDEGQLAGVMKEIEAKKEKERKKREAYVPIPPIVTKKKGIF